jgi:quercetin dioxygenase-like cupin family protein
MHKLLFVSVAALLAAAPAQAKTHKAGLKWSAAPPALPAGAQMAVVKGDPGKPGAFTIQLKFPANYAIPPHHHPTDETVRVLSAGQLNYGMGDKLDKANAGTLTKGYHVVMAAEMNHWVFTTDPVEVQVSGTGPFAIVYVDPKDDPRTK